MSRARCRRVSTVQVPHVLESVQVDRTNSHDEEDERKHIPPLVGSNETHGDGRCFGFSFLSWRWIHVGIHVYEGGWKKTRNRGGRCAGIPKTLVREDAKGEGMKKHESSRTLRTSNAADFASMFMPVLAFLLHDDIVNRPEYTSAILAGLGWMRAYMLERASVLKHRTATRLSAMRCSFPLRPFGRSPYSPAVGILVLAAEELVDELLRGRFVSDSRRNHGVVALVLRHALIGGARGDNAPGGGGGEWTPWIEAMYTRLQ